MGREQEVVRAVREGREAEFEGSKRTEKVEIEPL